jgi:hypothetical protein
VKLLVNGYHIWIFLATRTAPRGPKINNGNFT